MSLEEYEQELNNALSLHSDAVGEKIRLMLSRIPERAEELQLVIFPSLDGEGDFSVRASLEGPNAFILNKAINEHAQLFDVYHTESGFSPELPMVDPFSSDFEVNDILCDTVSN